jgi:tRNA threonylcarbamoyladenosine biosynthesis protein TsaE
VTGAARVVELPDEAATARLGAALLGLDGPALVLLEGDLGAGKTTLVRGFLRAAGHAGPVRSPTYTLVESYRTERCAAHHFDLYRLGDPLELEELGVRDYFAGDAWCFVEWPERAAGLLPPAELLIELAVVGTGRRATLRAGSERIGARLRDARLDVS